MKIRDCMKRNVVSISLDATIGEAAQRLAERHIGTLPVVDGDGHLMGVLQLRDLLKLVLPDFLTLVDDFDFVHDFGVLEMKRPAPEILARPVKEFMQRPNYVPETCGLLRSFAILRYHDLHDLPVVNEAGVLVGIASRVDIGSALLLGWQDKPG